MFAGRAARKLPVASKKRFDLAPGATFILKGRMKVRDVMGLTGLTRKALYYYEEIGIVHPDHDPENGYRDYSNDDARKLRTVANLIKLGVEIADVRLVIAIDGHLDEEKANEILCNRLENVKQEITELERQKNLISACIDPAVDGLTERLTVAARATVLDARERSDYMKKQLTAAFPGGFGSAMSAIFAPFLNEPVDTAEKERAWISLIEAIDDFDPVVLPEEFETLSEGVGEGVSLINELDDPDAIDSDDARLAVWGAEYLVHHAGAFLEPFFGYLEVLSSRFRGARSSLLKIAKSIEKGSDAW